MTPLEIILGIITLLSLGLSVFLYLQINRREQHRSARWMKRQQSLETELGKLRGSIAEMKSRIAEVDVTARTPTPPSGFANPINLNRRSEAIRMFRRGESPERVAELLGCPRQEARLLLTVYKSITAPKPAEPEPAPMLEPAPPVPQPAARSQAQKAIFPTITQEEVNRAATIV